MRLLNELGRAHWVAQLGVFGVWLKSLRLAG
jgi:hypothetical protein